MVKQYIPDIKFAEFEDVSEALPALAKALDIDLSHVQKVNVMTEDWPFVD